MKSVDGETYNIETLTKILFRNRSLLGFLFIFSSDFVFHIIVNLIYLSYIVEFFLRSDQTEDEDDDHKEVEKILTDLESLRKECGEIREELNWNKLIYKVNNEVKDSMQELNKDVKSVTDKLHETIQETTKEVKIFTDQLHETCLVIGKTAKEETYLNFQIDKSKRVMIRGEDGEKVSELKEKVRRLSLEAEIVAEELSRETANLVEAMTQQWEEENAEYLASLGYLDDNY